MYYLCINVLSLFNIEFYEMKDEIKYPKNSFEYAI